MSFAFTSRKLREVTSNNRVSVMHALQTDWSLQYVHVRVIRVIQITRARMYGEGREADLVQKLSGRMYAYARCCIYGIH